MKEEDRNLGTDSTVGGNVTAETEARVMQPQGKSAATESYGGKDWTRPSRWSLGPADIWILA